MFISEIYHLNIEDTGNGLRLTRNEYGGILVTLFARPFDHNHRLIDSAFQISAEGDYRDLHLYSAQLLDSNEVLVLLPSLSQKWFNEQNYSQLNEYCTTSAPAHEEAMISQHIMRTTYMKNGNEHLRTRAIVFTVPEDYKLSNEVFSPEAFNRIDPRSKMYTCPCEVSYRHESIQVQEKFFRAMWRFNKHTNSPLVTTIGPSHQDASLNDLNNACKRMNRTSPHRTNSHH